MKKAILIIVCFIGFLLVSNSMLSQNSKFFVSIGGNVKHSFPKSNASRDLLILEIPGSSSRANFAEPGYEFTAGVRFSDRFDILIGINSEIGSLRSSPYDYELNFQKINYPLSFRYHLGSSQTSSNFLNFGVSWGKILHRELSKFSSTWQHYYLEDWNDATPFCLEFGLGRSYSVNEKTDLVINPFLNYELSDNKILKGFYSPISLGIKISYEINLK